MWVSLLVTKATFFQNGEIVLSKFMESARRCQLLLWSMVVGLSGCQHQSVSNLRPEGVQPDYEAFVPAQIAVVGCSGPFSSKVTDTSDLCRRFDESVLQAFSGQPLMNGFAPKAVNKLLDMANLETAIEKALSKLRVRLWPVPVPTPVASTEILPLLHDISRATRYSDAILIPLIAEKEESMVNERGMTVARRKLFVGLYLLDLNNGRLIWYRTRRVVREQAVVGYDVAPPGFVPWEEISKQAFHQSFWLGFPGRTAL